MEWKEWMMADLTRPEGNERAEGETGLDFAGRHGSKSSTEAGREGADGAGLDLDLGHLQRAESDIGEHLC
jgi:hypothetical protein